MLGRRLRGREFWSSIPNSEGSESPLLHLTQPSRLVIASRRTAVKQTFGIAALADRHPAYRRHNVNIWHQECKVNEINVKTGTDPGDPYS